MILQKKHEDAINQFRIDNAELFTKDKENIEEWIGRIKESISLHPNGMSIIAKGRLSDTLHLKVLTLCERLRLML